MPLPTNLPATAEFPTQNYRLGPFEANGALWLVMRYPTNNARVSVLKSVDGGENWTTPGISGVASGTLTSIWAVLDGNDILITAQVNVAGSMTTTRDLYFFKFDTVNDVFYSGFTLVSVAAIADAGIHSACSITRRSNGDLIIAAQGPATTTMGTTYSRVYYYKSTDGGATWNAGVQVDDNREVQFRAPVVNTGANDRVHFTYHDGNLYHRSLDSSDVFDTAQGLALAFVISSHYPYTSVVFDGTEFRGAVGTLNSGDFTRRPWSEFSFPDAANGALTEVQNISDLAHAATGDNVTGAIAVDGTTVHLLYADNTDKDLYLTTDEGSGWGAADTELLDVVTVNHVSAAKVTGAIGYVYDDGGTIKYNELTLSGGGTNVAGSQASETDTAVAGSHTTVVNVAGSQATESNTANAGSFSLDKNIAGSQALETDSASAGNTTVAANVAGVQANETDSVSTGSPSLALVGAQASEADVASAGSNTTGVTAAGGQAVETDTASAGSHTTNAQVTGAQASEVDTPTAGTVSVQVLIAGNQAAETDVANAGTGTLAITGLQAAETDVAIAGAHSTTQTVTGAQASETDTANAGSPTAGVTVAGAQATETDAAAAGGPNVVANIAGSQATETDTANAGTVNAGANVAGAQATETNIANDGGTFVVANVTGSQAPETDTANAGSPTVGVTVAGSQAAETDAAIAGAHTTTANVAGAQASETDTANAGSATAGGTVTGAQAAETDTANAGSTFVTTSIIGSQAMETDTGYIGSSTVVVNVAGGQAVETTVVSAGAVVVGLDHGERIRIDVYVSDYLLTVLCGSTSADLLAPDHRASVKTPGYVVDSYASDVEHQFT